MGNLIDCIKGTETGEREGSLQQKARKRSARRHLSSFPQWIPPSPSFPLPSPLPHGSRERDLTITAGQQSPKDRYQWPHPSPLRYHVSPLVVTQGFMDNRSDPMPYPSHPIKRRPANPLASGSGPIGIHSNPLQHNSGLNGGHQLSFTAQPSLKAANSNNFAAASSNLPSSDIAVNPLMGPQIRTTFKSTAEDKGEHPRPAESQDLLQTVETSEDWSLFTKDELEFRKPKAARKLMFVDDNPPSENSCPNLNGRSVVDVNFANVHELRVVGFTEKQAGDVVDYRVSQQQHFQSKTELKEIPGIDEETWQKVKSRITLVPSSVRSSKGPSRSRNRPTGTRADTSSKASSIHHIDVSKDIKPEVSRKFCIDLNSCNEQQLRALGLTQSQATAVVRYRIMVGGAFKSVEDLQSVPGISEDTYLHIQTKVTLAAPQPSSGRRRKQQGGMSSLASTTNPPSGLGMFESPNSIPPNSSNQSQIISPASRIAGSNLSHKGGIGSNKSQNTIHSVAGIQPYDASPFSAPRMSSERSEDGGNAFSARSPVVGSWLPGDSPKASPRSAGGKKTALRIASWNLQVFNEEKVGKPGVLEVVCSAIVQHGFDIIAVQEIGCKSSLEKVCQELNNPSLPKVQSLGSNERRWGYCVSEKYTGRMYGSMEYSGFLWNRCSGVTLDGCKMINTDLFVRKPFTGTFMVKGMKFVVVSVHLKAENWGGKDKQRVENEVLDLPFLLQSIDQEGFDVILLGDFNLPPSSACFEPLHTSGYSNILNDEDYTNISSTNPEGRVCYDNIWVSSYSRCLHYNERHGVVRRNLAIPPARAGEKCQMVSDHCPIWARFLIVR